MKKRLDSLNALRALACLIVFIHHSGISCAVAGAVCVFFMLSGFTMTYNSHDRDEVAKMGAKSSLRFAVGKVRKLYALYLLCSLPVLLLDLLELRRAFSAEGVILMAKKIAASVLLIQSWVPNAEIALAFNGVAWYLSTALFLYFAFPFVLRQIKKLASGRDIMLTAAALFAVQFALGFAARPLEAFMLSHGLIPADGKFAYWFTYIFPPFRLFDFSIGCCLGLLYTRRSEKDSVSRGLGMEVLTIVLLIISSLVFRNADCFLTDDAFIYTQLFVPLASASVYTFALGQGPITKLLTNRATLFLSRISSDFFLLHQNIIRLSIMFLSMLAIPFSSIKIIVPILCFALSVLACLIWAKIVSAVKLHLKKQ